MHSLSLSWALPLSSLKSVLFALINFPAYVSYHCAACLSLNSVLWLDQEPSSSPSHLAGSRLQDPEFPQFTQQHHPRQKSSLSLYDWEEKKKKKKSSAYPICIELLFPLQSTMQTIAKLIFQMQTRLNNTALYSHCIWTKQTIIFVWLGSFYLRISLFISKP